MWINPLFEAEPRRALAHLVSAESLATVVAEDPLCAAHLPLLLEEGADGQLVLLGHVPRADPVADAVAAGDRVLCIVHGPRAYVSPDWYEDVGLPTYNYAVAHLRGQAEPMEPADTRAHLVDLIRVHEERKEPAAGAWEPDEAAHDRVDRLLPAVLGFRIRVEEAQAKEKLGQTWSGEDRASTVEHLTGSDRPEHHDVARLMQERGCGE